MPEQEPNYVKEVLTSQWNYGFIGVMFLLMVVVNFIGFGALLVAGEIVAALLAQLPVVQRYYRLRSQIEGQANLKEKEIEIVNTLPPQYQRDFSTVEQLCNEIEQRWQTQGVSTNNYLLKDLISKLGTFRFEYVRMLQAHHITATRDIHRLSSGLQNELERNEGMLKNERSPKVREVLEQNVRIIKQRLQRVGQLQDLLRLLEARLAVVKNSLSLLQDEIYTTSSPESMSSAVNNLLLSLNIDDELKATYEDVLSSKAETSAPLPTTTEQQPNRQAQRQSNLRRVK
jgi:hypothetical protein